MAPGCRSRFPSSAHGLPCQAKFFLKINSGALVGRVYWHSIITMQMFDARFWNLSQAAAWVVYRKRKLVEKFSEQTADSWRALKLYPKMSEFKPVGDLNELGNALLQGSLTAWGRRNEIRDVLEAIPSREWDDLWISPPSIKRSHPMAGQIEPWTDVRFESSDLKKLWRSLSETEGRTKYKWDVLKIMWHEINMLHTELTQNEKISELQLKYAAKFGVDSAPSRTTIQNRIKRW